MRINLTKTTNLQKNIFANYIGMAWNILSIYFFIPFYIRYLDAEEYGLIMFAVTLQAVIALFDAGFSSSLRREFAISKKDALFAARSITLIKTIERFYGIIFLSFILLSVLFSGWLGTRWFKDTSFTYSQLSIMITLLVANSVVLMQSGLYNGGFQALEKQVFSNVLQMSFSFFRNGLVIFIIILWPNPISFLLWQFFVTVMYITIQRAQLYKILNSFSESGKIFAEASMKVLKKTWKVSSMFLLMSILSTINFQTDKLVISKVLPIQNLGYYNTAYTLGQVIVSICGPIATALSPILMQNFANSNNDKTIRLFHLSAKSNSILIASIGTTLLLNHSQLVFFWTHNAQFSNSMSTISIYMILAGMALSAQIIPYNMAVASADMKPVIIAAVFNIIVTVPAYYLASISNGLLGCAVVWMSSNIIMLFLNVFLYLRKTLPSQYLKWVLNDLFLPLFVVGSIVFCLDRIRPQEGSVIIDICITCVILLASVGGGFLIFFNKEIFLFLSQKRIN